MDKICSQVKNVFFQPTNVTGDRTLEKVYLHKQDDGLTSERILLQQLH